MSILSEINRINDAKDDLVTSIEGKGVSVPDGTKIDALATYVDAITTAADIPAAGTELGTVKSGGDVTISSGIITVKDDSHNHVISNVDGLQSALDAKLAKTTYEESKELALGSNGKVCLGKFGAYDTNITIELNSTTNNTYHATIVIHSQNVVANGTGGTVGCYVYDDADNHITPLISVFRPYGSASRQIEVYADLPGWSKNLVHVQGVAISTGGMTDVLTSVSTIPTAIDGKIKVTPVNVLTTNFASKTEVAAKADQADVDQLYDMADTNLAAAKKYADTVAAGIVGSAPETLNALNELAAALGNDPNFATTVTTQLGKKANDADLKAVAKSGSYNDLTNKPTIPTKTSQLTNDSGFKTTDNNTTYSLSKSGSTIILTGSDGSTSSVTDSNSTSYLPLSGGNMTGVINYAGATQQVLAFAPDNATWRGGLKYSWTSNTTIGLWGKHPMSQFVWHAGTDFASADVNGTTVKNYDFQIGRDAQTGTPIVRTTGSFSEGGTLLSDKYVTNAKLEQVLGSYVNDIDALLGG